MQAQKNTESTYGGVVGASMLGKLGIGAGAGAGAGAGGVGTSAVGLGGQAPMTNIQGGGGGY